MKERYKSNVAVFLILTRQNDKGENEILLQKRKNTGYMDGMYDLAATGHLEENESLKDAMVRESFEEIGIKIKKEDLELVTVYQENYKDLGYSYLRFFFKVKKYKGIPKVMEPHKFEGLLWVNVNEIPKNTIYHIKNALKLINKNINYFDAGFNI